VGKAVGVGDVCHGDVIGDNELFQAGAEGFAKGGIRFDPEGIGGGADSAVGLQFPLGADDGGTNGLAGDDFF
jgi:hypothetical protein